VNKNGLFFYTLAIQISQMKKSILLLLSLSLLSCKKEGSKNYKASFKTVTVDTLLTDEISIRGLTIDGDKAWYAGNNGKYGWVSLNGGKNFNGVAVQDTLMPEFRAIAQTNSDIFILNVGSPALLYKVSKDGKQSKIVYTETGEKVFYDSMKFRNDKEGIAIGDPVDGCLSVIITSNGGDTWTKIPCSQLPSLADGEAAFAASNTNVIVKGKKTWIVSGGKKSRVFFTASVKDKFEVYDTPIVQGKEMTGMFSVDFYDDEIGFAIGGDYEKPEMNSDNKIFTEDGGKTWKKVGQSKGFGYGSCVQFIPESNGDELVTAGASGIYYSFDRGENWKQISTDKTIHTLRFLNNKTIIAAGQNNIIRLQLQ